MADLDSAGTFASQAEVIEKLNELLAAERAGARVAVGSRRERTPPMIDVFFRRLSHDEAACCAMLSRHIGRLGGVPTAEVGTFHGAAMAIADIKDRLVFLNRGQTWVVRKLEALILRLRDNCLVEDLGEMLATHRTNIQSADELIALLDVDRRV